MTIEASQLLYTSGLNAKVYKFDGIMFSFNSQRRMVMSSAYKLLLKKKAALLMIKQTEHCEFCM